MNVTVVVPVLNARRFLEPCLTSIGDAMEHTRRCQVELILVDNGSTDGSLEYLREVWGDRARILQLPGATISAVRNRGAHEATGVLLSFIDADCVVKPDYFDRAVDTLEATGATATGSTYALPDDPHWIERSWQRMHESGMGGSVKHLNAGNFLVLREAFEAVGGFDERLTTGEDAELCLRLVGQGYTIFEDPAVAAAHLGNPKTVGHFFRKQRWHALGMFGTFRRDWRDLPVFATFAHFAALVAALVLLAGFPGAWVAWLLSAGLVLAVPVLTVAFRALKAGRPPSLPGVFLYEVYFVARIAALWLIIKRAGAGDHRG